MFDALRDAIQGLEVPVHDAALLDLVRLRDRLDARVAEAVGDYDASQLWGFDGSASMAGWLQRHAKTTARDAKRLVVTAQRVRRCPSVRAAWEEGRLTSGQVDVIVANVSEDTVELFAEHEAELVERLIPLRMADLARAMQAWAERAKAALATGDDPPPDEPQRSAHLSPLLDGRGRLDADLDPEGFEVASAALRIAETKDGPLDEPRTPAQRRGDALVDILRFYLDHQREKLGGRRRPHVNVVIDLADLQRKGGGRTLDGTPLDGATLRRMCCDADVHRVVTDGRSSILDYGRATRTIPPAVYTSLVLRDLGCRFPGCTRPARFTEGHHIWHWEDGGPTCLSNLVLLCSRHHHVVHQRGWELKLLPSGTVEVTDPRGQVHTSDPPADVSTAA